MKAISIQDRSYFFSLNNHKIQIPATSIPALTMATDDPLALLHPFYPQNIILSNYIPNDWDVPALITAFVATWALISGVTLAVVRKQNPDLKSLDQLLVLWFILTGSIHFFFEGYYVYNHSRMPSMQDFFGQLWKEYALSDSRYMLPNAFVLCMETWTALLWGPLSFLTAYLITTNSPYRHPVQALVSTGQFYGDLLYYATSLFDDFYSGLKYCRPEPYYFWVYFVFMNTFWLVVPALCIYSSIKASARAFEVMSKVKGKVEENGIAKRRLQRRA